MNLIEVKKYTEGVLKKWFPTKKTVIDKLGVNDQNLLTFDGEQVSKYTTVNMHQESILSEPIVLGISTTTSVATPGSLKKNIEDYAYAVVKIKWQTNNNMPYIWQATIDTHTTGNQWIHNNWFSSNSEKMASENGIVIRTYGKNFNIEFHYLEDTGSTMTIMDVVGYKFTPVSEDDLGHEHTNIDTLAKIGENGNSLTFNNKPVYAGAYKKQLWMGQLSRNITSGGQSAWTNTFSLTDSALNYDALIIHLSVVSGGKNYPITDRIEYLSKNENLWFGRNYGQGSSVYGNFIINDGGNIVFDHFYGAGFTSVTIKKIEGVKYGRMD